jgi:undecaprenyl-diphosphatase
MAAFAGIINLDKAIDRTLSPWRAKTWFRFVVVGLTLSCEFLIWTPVLMLIMYFDDSVVSWTAWKMFVAIVTSGFVTICLKNLVRRSRPEGDLGWFERRFDPYSFPSGHSSRAWAIVAISLIMLPVWATIGFAVWAVIIGWTRLAMGVHYFSDVAAGAILGFAVGIATYWLLFVT